ncbi:MAG: hypothetical protein ARM1_0642 [Candidatus Micrarchaeota archaeon]|nr:MAG: hypothetical protein ARM1_0642 [Candidatus Micrarchaeota archaeon]
MKNIFKKLKHKHTDKALNDLIEHLNNININELLDAYKDDRSALYNILIALKEVCSNESKEYVYNINLNYLIKRLADNETKRLFEAASRFKNKDSIKISLSLILVNTLSNLNLSQDYDKLLKALNNVIDYDLSKGHKDNENFALDIIDVLNSIITYRDTFGMNVSNVIGPLLDYDNIERFRSFYDNVTEGKRLFRYLDIMLYSYSLFVKLKDKEDLEHLLDLYKGSIAIKRLILIRYLALLRQKSNKYESEKQHLIKFFSNRDLLMKSLNLVNKDKESRDNNNPVYNFLTLDQELSISLAYELSKRYDEAKVDSILDAIYKAELDDNTKIQLMELIKDLSYYEFSGGDYIEALVKIAANKDITDKLNKNKSLAAMLFKNYKKIYDIFGDYSINIIESIIKKQDIEAIRVIEAINDINKVSKIVKKVASNLKTLGYRNSDKLIKLAKYIDMYKDELIIDPGKDLNSLLRDLEDRLYNTMIMQIRKRLIKRLNPQYINLNGGIRIRERNVDRYERSVAFKSLRFMSKDELFKYQLWISNNKSDLFDALVGILNPKKDLPRYVFNNVDILSDDYKLIEASEAKSNLDKIKLRTKHIIGRILKLSKEKDINRYIFKKLKSYSKRFGFNYKNYSYKNTKDLLKLATDLRSFIANKTDTKEFKKYIAEVDRLIQYLKNKAELESSDISIVMPLNMVETVDALEFNRSCFSPGGMNHTSALSIAASPDLFFIGIYKDKEIVGRAAGFLGYRAYPSPDDNSFHIDTSKKVIGLASGIYSRFDISKDKLLRIISEKYAKDNNYEVILNSKESKNEEEKIYVAVRLSKRFKELLYGDYIASVIYLEESPNIRTDEDLDMYEWVILELR